MPVRSYRVDQHEADAYGLAAASAVLVRPDGFVAWRTDDTPDDPAATLAEALRTILSA